MKRRHKIILSMIILISMFVSLIPTPGTFAAIMDEWPPKITYTSDDLVGYKKYSSEKYRDLQIRILGLASKYFNQRAEWNLPRTYKKLEALISNEKSRMQMLASWDSIVEMR
ncbi:hypothetical protein [Paenibacillus cisolokensis]|nr:hypothetical protein [Paenibacillus cisolokensis]